MSLFDNLEHRITIYGPPVMTEDAAGAQVPTWPNVRASAVPCIILFGQGGEANEFSQSERQRQSHTIAFGDYDGGLQSGDIMVDDYTGRTFRFTGDRKQQGYGGIQDFIYITVTELG
jgi:hypothetical protein